MPTKSKRAKASDIKAGKTLYYPFLYIDRKPEEADGTVIVTVQPGMRVMKVLGRLQVIPDEMEIGFKTNKGWEFFCYPDDNIERTYCLYLFTTKSAALKVLERERIRLVLSAIDFGAILIE